LPPGALHYNAAVEFRQRLLETLRLIEPLFSTPGILVVGSEVPNLLEPGAAATLVVSQDVDLAVPVASHGELKRRLANLRDLRPSQDEPSVWVPSRDGLLEVNFLGLDPATVDTSDTYVLEDPDLPLLVFGLLSLLRPGPSIDLDGVLVPVPRLAGLLLEKLATERSGEKGDRDLLVALGLLILASEPDLAELHRQHSMLSPELRYTVRSNLASLSLLAPLPAMPDPRPHRARIAALLGRLEGSESE
jgi:hypothetical protein